MIYLAIIVVGSLASAGIDLIEPAVAGDPDNIMRVPCRINDSEISSDSLSTYYDGGTNSLL